MRKQKSESPGREALGNRKQYTAKLSIASVATHSHNGNGAHGVGNNGAPEKFSHPVTGEPSRRGERSGVKNMDAKHAEPPGCVGNLGVQNVGYEIVADVATVSQPATKINGAADGNGAVEPERNGDANGTPPVDPPRISTPLAAALYYHDHGCFVIPCCTMTPQGKCTFRHAHDKPEAVGKVPICGEGWQHLRLTREEIIAWWTKYPTANVAVLLEPSNLLVIDIDSDDATEEASANGLQPGPQVRADRGVHHYYSNPKKIIWRTTKQGDSRAIDILANGIVIGCGSTHRTGKQYELLVSWEEWPLEEPPLWAEQILTERQRTGDVSPITLPSELFPVDLEALPVAAWVKEVILTGQRSDSVPYQDRSEPLWAVELALVQAECDDATIGSVLLNPANAISAKPREKGKLWTAGDMARARTQAAHNAKEKEENFKKARELEATIEEQARAEKPAKKQKARKKDEELEMDELDEADEPDEGALSAPRAFKLTDLGNAERFVHLHGHDFLYCNPLKKWLTWDGTRWQRDNRQAIRKRGRTTVRGMYAQAVRMVRQVKKLTGKEAKEALAKQQTQLLAHAIKSESATRLNAMLDLAQMDVPVMPEQLDSNPWLLNVANGTLDLRTGKLQPHRREDVLTKYSPIAYDEKALCPQWEQFLLDIMNGKQEVIDFLWRAIGYSLTGNVREDCLFLLHGNGANGKTTFLNVLRALLADYSKQAAFSTFLHQERESVRNDLADLQGARLVVASEVDEGKRLSMSVVKALSGKDFIKARFLFAEFFEYAPQMKLWLAANYKPVIKGTDDGIWRRIRLVPFTQKFEKEKDDKQLIDKLKAELPGILAWAVRGCLAWQSSGLPMPETVATATADYRQESDEIGEFIEDWCTLEDGASISSSHLYEQYCLWCLRCGEEPRTKTAFGLLLKARGLNPEKGSGGIRQWKGIRIAHVAA